MLTTTFGKFIMTFLISMVPVVELRGGLPYGILAGLSLPMAATAAILGNMLPVPFIFLFARKVLVWGADKPVIGKAFTWILQKGGKAGLKLQKKGSAGLFAGLLLFVGIPLTGTARGKTKKRTAKTSSL